MLVELDLATLEEHIRKWKGPLILAGDFNVKARAWTGGPRDPRGDLLEEMMVTYNLVVANQPGVYTYEKGSSRSVLDLLFASPEVIKNISSWEVLDTELVSDHRYVSTKVLEKQNQRRKYTTKGGWSLQRMNRDKFLQRISAADLEGSATAEEAVEALMRTVTDACDAFMPTKADNLPQKTSLLVERGAGGTEE